MADYRPSQWMTRALSLVVNGFYAVIMAAAFINDDPPTPPGGWVLASVGVCMLASLAAWRWPRPGGLAVLLGTGAVAVSVLVSAQRSGLSAPATIIGFILYTVPLVLMGALFVAAGQPGLRKAGSP